MEIIEYAPKFKDDFIKFNTDRSIDNFGFLVNGDLFAYRRGSDKRRYDLLCGEGRNGACIMYGKAHAQK